MDLGPASVDQCQNLGRCSWRGGRSLSLGLVLRFRKVAGAEIGLWLAFGVTRRSLALKMLGAALRRHFSVAGQPVSG